MENVVEFPDNSTIDQEAAQWIVRLDADLADNKFDREEFREWIARSPEHREKIIQLASIWNQMDVLAELMVPLESGPTSAKANISRVGRASQKAPLAATPRGGFTIFARSYRAAAVLVCCSAVLFYFYLSNSSSSLRYATAIGEQVSQQLEDGSVVWLNTDSSIEIDYSDHARKLLLRRGEAYFDVVPNASRPFEVYAGKRLVRALGTAFSVYVDSGDVKIMVTEGKVELATVSARSRQVESGQFPREGSISRRTEESTVIETLGVLVAGQSIELAQSEQGSMKEAAQHELDEVTRRVSWTEGLLVFSGEPLVEVVDEVSRYTSTRIEISDPELYGLRIGGQFKVGETEALLDALESGFDMKITRVSDGHVQIRAR